MGEGAPKEKVPKAGPTPPTLPGKKADHMAQGLGNDERHKKMLKEVISWDLSGGPWLRIHLAMQFDPWSRKTSHAMRQLNLCTPATEACLLRVHPL